MTSLERYYSLRERGLCGQCGKMPAVNGCRCAFCNEVHNARNRRKKPRYRDGRPRYRERKERGLCVTCGIPIERFTRCLICRQKVNDSVQKTRIIWRRKYDKLYRLACNPKGESEYQGLGNRKAAENG
jgi:hypothetical protein